MSVFDKTTKEEAEFACSNADSMAQMTRNLGVTYTNGSSNRGITKLIVKYSLDITHFDAGKERRFKYKRIERECPACGDMFETQDGGKAEKKTCSYGCSNTHFRSGENNGSFQNGGKNYRTVCFMNHEKRCIICGEDVIVAVHHYDGNHENNNPKNLVPMCPTHHQYWHSKHKHLVEEKVIAFVESQ